jgi:ABC-2 type transport system ATP-binding protein
MKMIETRGLRKSFKTKTGVVEAVRGVDLSVAEGEIFGFLGPNGAGKTTTLRMLATLIEPDGGEATVTGYDLMQSPAAVRERIGYVSQTGGASIAATGHENLVLQARLFGMDKAGARERAEKMLELLDLSSVADRLVSTYSGGQKRRLDIALGMVHRPELLFLDEPTTGLDPQSRARLWDEVRRLRERGTGVFLTTHYLDEADALCDRLAIIDNGVIVAEGTPDALKRRISGDVVTLGMEAVDHVVEQAQQVLRGLPFVSEAEVVESEASGDRLRLYVEHGEQTLPSILRSLDEAGLAVSEVSLSRPTLDDVFLKQTGLSLREPGNAVAIEGSPSQAVSNEGSLR